MRYLSKILLISSLIVLCLLETSSATLVTVSEETTPPATESEAENEYEESEPVISNRTSQEKQLSFSYFLIIVIPIILIFAIGIIVIIWAVHNDRVQSRAMNNDSTAAMAGNKPTIIKTRLAPTTQINSEPKYNFPYPSDFDRIPGSEQGYYPGIDTFVNYSDEYIPNSEKNEEFDIYYPHFQPPTHL